MTNLLLDTHALLWYVENDPTMRRTALEAINDPQNEVFVSAVTAFEIAVKVKLGKMPAPPDVGTWLPQQLAINDMTPLPVTLAHAAGVDELPLHHADPFDRLLIAQARAERMTIVTRDPRIQRYEVRLLRC